MDKQNKRLKVEAPQQTIDDADRKLVIDDTLVEHVVDVKVKPLCKGRPSSEKTVQVTFVTKD